MGASQDLANEGLRRLVVNACYWAVGMEDQIPPKSDVDLVGHYADPFRVRKIHEGREARDFALPR